VQPSAETSRNDHVIAIASAPSRISRAERERGNQCQFHKHTHIHKSAEKQAGSERAPQQETQRKIEAQKAAGRANF
jgi:hypothetical protein